MSEVQKILGENIKKRRKVLNISQEALAGKLEITPKHLSNIESGQKFVSAALLERIKQELGISFSELFFHETDKSEIIKKVQLLIKDETSEFMKNFNDKLGELS